MRLTPLMENIKDYGWEEFEAWADEDGIGTHIDDWIPSWQCWVTACNFVYNLIHSRVHNLHEKAQN